MIRFQVEVGNIYLNSFQLENGGYLKVSKIEILDWWLEFAWCTVSAHYFSRLNGIF